AVIERASNSAAALGLPRAARRSATHVVDRFGGQPYDEVTEFDDQGHMSALQRFDAAGRIRAAVRFGWIGDGGPALTSKDAVGARAGVLARAVGVPVSGAGRILPAPSGAGWTVAWERTVDGARVLGDGIRIHLWPDGSLHSLSVAEHE